MVFKGISELLDLSLQVHPPTRLITSSKCICYFHSILASRCMFKLTTPRTASTSPSEHDCGLQVVLPTVPNSQVGCSCSSNPEQDHCHRIYHTKTRMVAIGPVVATKSCHFNLTTLAMIKYLSYDRIMTWTICRLCSFARSFTSRFQICNPTNIDWVAIENLQISHEIWRYFTVIQWILVPLQIWKREVKELLKLHNLHTDHVTIWSEVKNLIWPTL